MHRNGLLRTTATVLARVIGLGLVFIVLPSWLVVLVFRDCLWGIKVVDVAVVSGGLAVLFVIGNTIHAHIRDTTRLQARDGKTAAEDKDPAPAPRRVFEGLTDKLLPAAGAGLGLFLTVFVAYGALRNQSRLTAEIAINEDGGRIADWERSSAAVRCLYDWFDGAAPSGAAEKDAINTTADACLARIVADRDTYTEAMLYIEESFFILRRAARDRQQWGSTYYDEILYWQSDVGEDLTGLFAFHLLNRYPLKRVAENKELPAAEREMKDAGVAIKNLCAGAQRVQTCLHAVGRFTEPLPDGCEKEVLAATHPRLAAVSQACRAEAARLEAARLETAQSRPSRTQPGDAS